MNRIKNRKKMNEGNALIVIKLLLIVGVIVISIMSFIGVEQIDRITFPLLAVLLVINATENIKQTKVLSYISYGVALFLIAISVMKWFG